MTKKEVSMLDKIKEKGLELELFPEETGRSEETGEFESLIGAVDAGGDESKLMLQELKDKGVKVATIFNNKIGRELIKVFKEEADKDNTYSAVFLPIDNTDICADHGKLQGLLREIQDESGMKLVPYFEGHEKEEVEKRFKSIR